jgi:hypothetical protein
MERIGHQDQPLEACMASDLVGRPGLDPGTLGLKVLVKALRRGAVRLTASQNCRWKGQFDR